MSDQRDSRRQILDSLRAAQSPFPDARPPQAIRPVTPRAGDDPAALVAQFVAAAQALACQVHRAAGEQEALAAVLALLQGESAIACWEPEQIPLPGLQQALTEAGIERAAPGDASLRVGLSGVQAALAATGSIVLASGPGRYRAASLLPPVHIAVLRQSQIVPDLESWLAGQRADGFTTMRQSSNIVIISGPSRTADIAMELVMGMHGPQQLHLILLPQ